MTGKRENMRQEEQREHLKMKRKTVSRLETREAEKNKRRKNTNQTSIRRPCGYCGEEGKGEGEGGCETGQEKGERVTKTSQNPVCGGKASHLLCRRCRRNLVV